MTPIKKFAALAVASLSIAVASAPSAEAGWRHRHGGLLAAGLLGGAVLGAAMARPAYGYGGGYVQPVYSGGECIRKTVGYTVHGYPIRKTVCY